MSSSVSLGSRWFGFHRDLSASLVVVLVAVPLSMGIALASGAPVSSGLIAAMVGGLVVSLIGGSPLQVSGPAAGLSVIVFGLIQEFGFEVMCAITVGAGVLQVLFGLVGAARAFVSIPPAVIQAMLAGIGVLIVLGQIHVLLGFGPEANAWANLTSLPERVLSMKGTAALIGGLVLAVLLLLSRYGKTLSPLVPVPLVAISFSTALAAGLGLELPRVAIDPQLLSELVPHWSIFRHFGGNFLELSMAALGLCLVASAESLLCALATDKLTNGPKSNLTKELIGQGLGNMMSGFLGGLPVTGVIVRSSANIQAGAQTKWSGFFHGVWIAVFLAFFVNILNLIPLSALAGLLIFTGIKLINMDEFEKTWRRGDGPIYLLTLFGVVFLDLLWGISLGIASAFIAHSLSRRARVAETVEPTRLQVDVAPSSLARSFESDRGPYRRTDHDANL